MRHRRTRGRLGRTGAHRKAMLRNLVSSLFLHQRVTTTLAKAKEARRFAERLITLAKKDNNLNTKRMVFAALGSEKASVSLLQDIAPLFKDKNGGYTRLLRLGLRHGDGAELAILELTEKKLKVAKPRVIKEEKPQEIPKEAPPKPHIEKRPEKQPPKIEKPRRGFMEGLRKIFRRKV